MVAKAAETNRTEAAKEALGQHAAAAGRPRHRTGHPRRVARLEPDAGPPHSPSQALAYADPAPHAQPQAVQQNGAIKPAAPAVVRTGWIIQVGALESESEAKQRIDLARNKASSLLSKADPFTEPVVSKDTHAVPRPFRRPRARSGRSGLPDAQARRHFLHYRSQLIRHLV